MRALLTIALCIAAASTAPAPIIIRPPGGGGAPAGTSPGTTLMTAAYDFTSDATDSHTNSLDWTEGGTPAYTGGYVTVTSSDSLSQGTIDQSPYFHWSYEDVAVSFRVRLSSTASDQVIWGTAANDANLTYDSTNDIFTLKIGGVTVSGSTVTVTDTDWHVISGYWDTGADVAWMSVDGESLVSQSGAELRRYGDFNLGSAVTVDIDIDRAWFWDGREIDQDEVDWLNAARVYSDL